DMQPCDRAGGVPARTAVHALEHTGAGCPCIDGGRKPWVYRQAERATSPGQTGRAETRTAVRALEHVGRSHIERGRSQGIGTRRDRKTWNWKRIDNVGPRVDSGSRPVPTAIRALHHESGLGPYDDVAPVVVQDEAFCYGEEGRRDRRVNR